MATQVQLRRGTATENNSFTGAQGELTFDTTNKRVRIHDGATAGGFELKTENSSGDTLFADNEKAIFGAGSDLQIYHDGSNSFIKDAGTGNLLIQSDANTGFQNASGTEWKVEALTDGAVNIYYDGSQKLATTSTGIDVTGRITTDAITEDTSGNVGIGTSSPDTKLVIANGSDTLKSNLDSDSIDVFASGKTFNLGTTSNNVMRFFANNAERMRIDSSGRVGIGDVPKASFTGHSILQVGGQAILGANDTLSSTGQTYLSHNLYYDTSGTPQVFNTSTANEGTVYTQVDGVHKWSNSAATTGTPSVQERMRIDSSGNLLVGKTATSLAVAGARILPTGQVYSTASGAAAFAANRLSSDGNIMELYKDTGLVGSIGTFGSRINIGTGDVGILFDSTNDTFIPWNISTNASRSGAISFGDSTDRFKDLYLSGGVYLGGTGAANKLDDYEEGTFTPVMADGSSGGNTATGGVQAGRYVKIGKVVYIYVLMLNKVTTGLTGSNDLNIRSLPFTAYGSGTTYQQGSIKLDRITFSGYCTAQIQQGTTSLKICENISGSAHDFVACNQVNSGGNEVLISAVYETS